MAKASPGITNFTSGELSPKLEGRTDLDKYFNGCRKLENFLVHPHGGATRRPGTKFITEVQDSTKKHRLIPFEFNVEQTYALEFGDGNARIITNDGVLQEPERQAYQSSANPNLLPEFGLAANQRSEIIWSDDGLKGFNVQYNEVYSVSDSEHFIEVTIDQFDCPRAYALQAAPVPAFTFRGKFENHYGHGCTVGHLILHCGVFWAKADAADDSGSALYFWDGWPPMDVDTQTTNVEHWRMFRVDMSTAFSISSIANSDASTRQSINDALFYDQISRFGNGLTANLYPIPVSAVSIIPAFNSLIVDNNGVQDTTTWTAYDADGIIASQPTRTAINKTDGFFMVCSVSHLINGSATYPGTAGTSCREHETIQTFIGKEVANVHVGYDLSNSNDAVDDWPTLATSLVTDYRDGDRSIQGNYKYDDIRSLIDLGDVVTGMQIRSVRDYWVKDSSGNLWHETYGSGDSEYVSDQKYLINSTVGIEANEDPAIQPHAAATHVLYFTTLNSSTNAADATYNFYALPFRFDNDLDIEDTFDSVTTNLAGARKLSTKDFGGQNSGEKPASATGLDRGPKAAFVTYDGKNVWYSDGLDTADLETNITTRAAIKYPYLVLGMDTNVEGINTSQTEFGVGFILTDTFDQLFNYEKTDVLSPARDLLVPIPYTSAQLDKITFSQSADVLYLAHNDVPPQKLVRFGATLWSCSDVTFLRGPFLDPIPEVGGAKASALTSDVDPSPNDGIDLEVSTAFSVFSPNDLGRLVKVHDGFGRIVKYVNPSKVKIEVLENEDRRRELLPSYTATTISAEEGDPDDTFLAHNDRFQDSDGQFIIQGFKVGMKVNVTGFTGHANNNETAALIVEVTADTLIIAPAGDLTKEAAGSSVTIKGVLEFDEDFQLGAWSKTTGYPAVTAFYEQRLVFANTGLQPQTIFFSKGSSFEDFTPGTGSNSALTYTIGSGQVNVIEYLAGSRFLVVGTSGGEFVVSSGGVAEPLSPTNTQIRKQANYGSSSIQPVTVANVILFVQRAGRKLRELTYNYDTDSYFAPDMCILSEHVTKSGISRIAFQQEPDNIIWCALNDGGFIGMTYRREENVVAWHTHDLGGTNVSVEDVMTLPTDLNEDELYLIVRRTIDGVTKRFIERLTVIDFGSDIKDAWHVDSGLQYNGAATTSITGLDHLEGETVEILADGFAVSDKIVSSGEITLDTAASKVTIGLPFTSTLQTMRIDAGGTEGTAQGKTKRIRDVTFRFFNTVSADVGPSEENLDPISFRESTLAAATPTPLFSGDKDITFPSGYDSDGFIVVKQDQALPMTVLAVYPRLQTFDR